MRKQPILNFEQRSVYGKLQYYPMNSLAQAILDVTGRKCLKHDEVLHLMSAGFKVAVEAVISKSNIEIK